MSLKPRMPMHGMGGGVNKPTGNQFNMNLNIMALPNAKCLNCDHEEFTTKANIKMISPMQSPNGQWAHAAAQQWICRKCDKPFIPEEWINNKLKEEKEKGNAEKKADGGVIILPDSGGADK